MEQTDINFTPIPSQIKFLSKSLDDLQIRRQRRQKQIDGNHVSNTTRTEMDLTGIGCDNNIETDKNQLSSADDDDDDEHDLRLQRCYSAPVSPTRIYDKELAAFIECEQQQQQMMGDSFVYNIDLSDTNETTHQSHPRSAIFFVSLYIVIFRSTRIDLKKKLH